MFLVSCREMNDQTPLPISGADVCVPVVVSEIVTVPLLRVFEVGRNVTSI